MTHLKLMVFVCVAAALGGWRPLMAQTQSPSAVATATAGTAVPDGGPPRYIRPETPEERLKRIATTEDPGPDPDPKKKFIRFGKANFIHKYDIRWAKYDNQPTGWVRPFGMVNAGFEIYQLNDKYIWVWAKEEDFVLSKVSPEESAANAERQVIARVYSDDEIAFLQKIRDEFRVIEPAASGKLITFEDASNGLPTEGSWRNSLSVADMNGDGFADIIAPPQRGVPGTNMPFIFLGNGKGEWKPWADFKFPRGLDYGSVVAADFDKDNRMDLAFGVHLRGVFVFLGDGKGGFRELEESGVSNFPTRRIRTADLDADGWLDIVAVTEGPTARGFSGEHSPVIGLLNRRKGTAFELIQIAPKGLKTGADYLSLGRFNDDKYPDLLVGSIFFNSWDVLFLSQGASRKWAPYTKNDGNVIPSLAYFFGSTFGKFSSKEKDDPIVSYVRIWPNDADVTRVKPPDELQMTSVERLVLGKDGVVTRIPIMRWKLGDEVRGLESGDVDGDGHLDIVFSRSFPRELVVLLGDGKGGFKRADVGGITLEKHANYDLTLKDVNGDRKPDVVIAYEALPDKNALAKKTGSIHVYLNRGVTAAP